MRKIILFAFLGFVTRPALSAHQLYDFESDWESEEWTSADPETQAVAVTERFATCGSKALSFVSAGSAFAPELKGLVWDNDWESYEYLAFDIVNPMSHKLRLKVFPREKDAVLDDVAEAVVSLGLNEKESVQIVVEPVEDRLRDVTVAVDDLVAGDGAKIPSDRVDCRRRLAVRKSRSRCQSVEGRPGYLGSSWESAQCE